MTVTNPTFQEEINDIVTILAQLEASPIYNSPSRVIPPSGNTIWKIQRWAMGADSPEAEVFHKVTTLTDNQLNSRLRLARDDFQLFSYKQSGILRWMTPARFNERELAPIPGTVTRQLYSAFSKLVGFDIVRRVIDYVQSQEKRTAG